VPVAAEWSRQREQSWAGAFAGMGARQWGQIRSGESGWFFIHRATGRSRVGSYRAKRNFLEVNGVRSRSRMGHGGLMRTRGGKGKGKGRWGSDRGASQSCGWPIGRGHRSTVREGWMTSRRTCGRAGRAALPRTSGCTDAIGAAIPRRLIAPSDLSGVGFRPCGLPPKEGECWGGARMVLTGRTRGFGARDVRLNPDRSGERVLQ